MAKGAMLDQSVADYLAALQRDLNRGDATEHTHRPALKTLFEASGQFVATNEPKGAERENKPDYIIRRGPVAIGFVEAKDIGKDLKTTLKSAQLKRYMEALPNLLLTDYVDFIWLVGGEKRMEISLAARTGKTLRAHPQAPQQWADLFNSFTQHVSPILQTPLQLAQVLAGQTRLLRDLAQELVALKDPDLDSQLQSFQTLLVPDLSDAEFADMYAQTAAYGLFTARVFEYTRVFDDGANRLPDSFKNTPFSLEKAEYLIPKANPFLRQFFQHIAGPDLNEQLRWLIEQIATGLNYVDMGKVLHVQGRKVGFEDPVFHFYESFLAQYDTALRQARGVYYTPDPVVDFIVRSVDDLLRTQLGKADGLADKDTVILDPATGTATFLRKVIEHIHATKTAGKKNAGLWSDYVRERLLPRLFGFELMMAPYTVAHLKLALQLQEQGFVFGKNKQGKDERLNIFLTNTLDTVKQQMDAYMAQWISTESEGAENVKRKQPVQVVLGNPPYAGESSNNSIYIRDLLDEYKQEPAGGKLQERNSKSINDDYVKFIRFAHDRITRTGHGIVAFITNHGWLDNPTFRGMRASLLRDFDHIYILDLHGNTKKREKTPDDLSAQGIDKNVFDIAQGVAIVLMVKHNRPLEFELSAAPNPQSARSARPFTAQIHHAQLWGSRDYKYDWLKKNHFSSVSWHTLTPALPLLLFVPRDETNTAEYQLGWKITDILPINSVGIVTARDHLVIQYSAADVRTTIDRFVGLRVEDARAEFELGKDARDWRVELAQKDILTSGADSACIVPIAYRPFDRRHTYYTGKSKGFHCCARGEVMRHFTKGKNVGLITIRQSVSGGYFSHVGVSDCLIDNRTFYSNKGTTSIFPLWLQQEQGVRANLSPQFLAALAAQLGLATDPEHEDLPMGVTPEQIMAYLYAVLHAPSYRRRYAAYLQSDFPRIPISVHANFDRKVHEGSAPDFKNLWDTLLPLGQSLIDAHLLKKMPPELRPNYPQTGTHEVITPRFEAVVNTDYGRVYINPSEYFDGVPISTWQFRVGAYQVCEKWLKDRKGRRLSLDDIEHYQNTVAALTQTQQVMGAIDRCVDGVLWPKSE